jgi:hypothetical protein
MAKITWTDKTALNPQPSIARENKCTDDDLNEIKQVVNTNDDNVGDLADLNTTDKTSVVNAVNELATGWTLIGTTTGNAEISLPSGWNELYACVSLGTDTSIYNTIITNSLFVGTTNKQLRFGYYLTSNSNSGGSIYITTSGTKAQTIENFTVGSDVLANTTTYWYYK